MKINDGENLHKEMRQGLSSCVSVMRDIFLEIQKDPGRVARFLQAVEFHQRILEEMAGIEEIDSDEGLYPSRIPEAGLLS